MQNSVSTTFVIRDCYFLLYNTDEKKNNLHRLFARSRVEGER